MQVSVCVLYEGGKRRSDYAIKAQRPAVGWLVLKPETGYYEQTTLLARLVDDEDRELIEPLEHATVVAGLGRRGMLLGGVQYRKKGSKHSIADKQQWWCQAPPRLHPLLDHAARVAAAHRRYEHFNAWLEGQREDD